MSEFRPRDYFTKSFASLLKGLLKKDPTKRLGHPDMGGIDSIKMHPFF